MSGSTSRNFENRCLLECGAIHLALTRRRFGESFDQTTQRHIPEDIRHLSESVTQRKCQPGIQEIVFTV